MHTEMILVNFKTLCTAVVLVSPNLLFTACCCYSLEFPVNTFIVDGPPCGHSVITRCGQKTTSSSEALAGEAEAEA